MGKISKFQNHREKRLTEADLARLQQLLEDYRKHVEKTIEKGIEELKKSNTPEYLTTDDAAKMTRFTRKTLESMRSRQMGPEYIKLGNTVRYRSADVRRWMENGSSD